MNVLVGQSGGPTAVINSSLYGIVKNADHVLGMVNGIEGFLEGKVIEFDDVELLKTTPGAYLGSCRYMLPEDLNDPVYEKLFKRFAEFDIDCVLYIGGNDSMDTVSKLSRCDSDIKFIGIPKTIDNDLVMTDHTPGFGSAAKYVANTVREIVVDASVYDKPAVTIVEIMGRHAGWLTAASVLARKFEGDAPYLIYLPEIDFDVDDFVIKVDKLLKEKTAVVVCVSEGIHDSDGNFICGATGVDNFGHKMLSGAGKYLENLLREKLGCKARSVELNVLQRCSAQNMSLTDQTEAIEAGAFGLQAAISGKSGYMVAFDNGECKLVDVNEVCNKEKKVPSNMIVDGCDISQDFIDYCKPLIQGNVDVVADENGLNKFCYRS